MYQITVETMFCAAHALRLADGSIEPVHEHEWRCAVTVASRQLDEIETVMDFHDLCAIVDKIVKPFHEGRLNEIEPFSEGRYNPSAERMAWWIGRRTTEQLPCDVALISLKLGEAPGSTATYLP